MILNDAIALINKNIEENLFHVDYERVVALAQLYKILATGDNIEPLLQRFIRREDEDMFEQRVRLTKIITPSVLNSIRMPFNKVTRNKKVIKKLDLKNDALNKSVDKMIVDFYGDEADNKGLDHWLRTRFVKLSFLDPNAFLVIEFDPFDYRYAKPSPRPFEVTSEEAINFKYKNKSDLEWLLVRQPLKFTEKKKLKDGFKYTLYEKDYTIVMVRVGVDYIPMSGEVIVKFNKDKEWYVQKVYEPKIGFCPAIRIGYVEDDMTDCRTYVSPYHCAMPYFMKSIKTVSEMDLSMSLHVFPQKMQYVKMCSGHNGKKCHDGCDTNGDACQTCGGRGFEVHTSAQDALYFPLPKEKEDMLPLNDLLVYKSPPIDLLTFLDGYIDKLELKSHRTIFNSDMYVSPNNQIAKTATEKNMEMESIYDTLGDFATRLSSVYVFSVWAFVKLADGDPAKGEIKHSFPADLKMETVATLLEKMKSANDSKAPGFVRDAINVDLAEAMYVDDETSLLRFKTKRLFYPFNGKTEEETTMLLNGQLVSEFDKILYANYEKIFNLLENEFTTDFYLWTPDKQWPEIEKVTNEIWDEIKTEQSAGMNDAFTAMRKAGVPTPAEQPELV